MLRCEANDRFMLTELADSPYQFCAAHGMKRCISCHGRDRRSSISFGVLTRVFLLSGSWGLARSMLGRSGILSRVDFIGRLCGGEVWRDGGQFMDSDGHSGYSSGHEHVDVMTDQATAGSLVFRSR